MVFFWGAVGGSYLYVCLFVSSLSFQNHRPDFPKGTRSLLQTCFAPGGGGKYPIQGVNLLNKLY